MSALASLHDAVLTNDESTAAKLLKDKAITAHIDDLDKDGNALLHIACRKHSDSRIVRLLLQAGAKVDIKGDDRETPLYSACFNEHLDVARVLLGAGANVNELNGPDAESVLHLASRIGDTKMLDLLLDSGANINLRNARMETPLFAAAKAGKVPTVYKLLLRDANVNLANDEGKPPLYIASEREHKGVVQLLKTERQYLKDVKAQVDVEERDRKAPIDAPEVLQHRVELTKASEAKEREADRQARAREQPRLCSIEVPEHEEPTHDPLTGKPLPPRYRGIEVNKSPVIPAGAIPKGSPDTPYGGTMMAVGTGTGHRTVPHSLLPTIPGDEAIVFEAANVVPPKRMKSTA